MNVIRCLVISSCALLLLFPGMAQAQVQTLAVQGVPVTGPNSLNGQQVTDFGPGISTGRDLVAAFNPNGSEPLPLTPDTPASTRLATIDADSAPANLINLPLRDVPGNVGTAGLTRQSLPGQLDVGTFDNNQSEPSGPITLGEWLEGSGVAKFQCKEGEAPTANLLVRDLLPNRLYTVWAVFQNGEGAVPFGGPPNVIMTDNSGDGTLSRVLNFCPLETTSEGADLLYLVVVFHSDQQVYAMQPTLPDAGLPPGVVAHPQLQFSVQGTSLLE